MSNLPDYQPHLEAINTNLDSINGTVHEVKDILDSIKGYLIGALVLLSAQTLAIWIVTCFYLGERF